MQKEMKNSQSEKDKKRLKELEVLISDEIKNKKENEERLENKEFDLEKCEYSDIRDQSYDSIGASVLLTYVYSLNLQESIIFYVLSNSSICGISSTISQSNNLYSCVVISL